MARYKRGRKPGRKPGSVKKEVVKTESENNKDSNLDILVDKKLQYDLLTKELFYLKEYVTLIDFDPSHSYENNDTFHEFLTEEGLTISNDIKIQEISSENTSTEPLSNASNGRIRRRHLRASSLPATNGINKSNNINDKDNDNDSIKDLNLELEKIQPFVNERMERLKVSDTDSKLIPLPKKNTVKQKEPVKVEQPTKVTKRKYNRVKKEEVEQNETLIEDTLVLAKNVKEKLNPTQYNDPNVDDEYYYFTESSEDELPKKRQTKRSKASHPKVHLYVNPPRQTVTNPENITKPKYNSVDEYLKTFKLLDEDMTLEEYDSFIKEQRKQAALIRKGLRNGVLRYDPESNSLQPVTTKETRMSQSNKPDPITFFYKEQNKHTFDEFLVNQGIHMSKLFRNNTKARISRARKVSQMIEQHFKHIASADDRKLKEEEKQRRFIGRTITQAVKRRWNIAEKAYRVLKRDEDEKLKTIQGKKHLSKMLEESTQLLGAQLNKPDGEDESEMGSTTTRSEGETDSSSTEDDDDDILSSSSVDEDEEEPLDEAIKTKSDDEQLSVEELKKKYQKMEQEDGSPLSESDASSVLTDEEGSSNISSSEEESEDTHLKSNSASSTGLGSLLGNGMEETDLDDSDDFTMSESENDENLSEDEEDVKNEQFNITDKSSVDDDNESKDLTPDDQQLSVVDVPVPSLLRGTLRIYQKQGLNWLASLYNNHTNGILADEMGLGKTIQTISLLAYLACEKQIWGPHLIVVPTSVLLNWEMEFKRFAPGLKVLTYYGSPQQRKEKRRGWNKPDSFHVCIVSYQLVVQDQHSFKRKKWQYMVLDEAHNIKNFRSARWQALLNFNTERRLLLTGTPLQNNLAELWSLLYFLMPKTMVNGKKVSGFADLDAFQQWFGRPVDKIIETGGGYEQDKETKKTVDKLHQILRPYLLRRLKKDVEKQMPGKYEHIVYCRLSKRQRFLYDEFMSRSQTRETLASGNFMSIVNCLMQLRKVCNHPDLFEVRPILTSFDTGSSVMNNYINCWKDGALVPKMLPTVCENKIDFNNLNLTFTRNEINMSSHHSNTISNLKCIEEFTKEVNLLREKEHMKDFDTTQKSSLYLQNPKKFYELFTQEKTNETIQSIEFQQYINTLRCTRKPVYGKNVINLLTIDSLRPENSEVCKPLIEPLQTRFLTEKQTIDNYAVLTPNAVSLDVRKMTLGIDDSSLVPINKKTELTNELAQMENPFHHLQTKLTIAFPDKSLLQYDCGKLQKLAILLRDLKDNGHRALIFTQMTKVLDVLEQFLNYHGYLYMRLDGATKIEDRQILTERFNTDNKITVFILSSRSGGLGINLTGADTVIFYDSDWNPAMDKQCQDRCHRIGQTRDVHIYRFVSEHTIESNILKKANQKRQLDNVVIQKGDFTTDYFSKLSVGDLFGSEVTGGIGANNDKPLLLENSEANKNPKSLEKLLAQAEDEDDVKAANLAMREVDIDNEDFEETPEGGSGNGEDEYDEYEGTNHVEEYMLRFIANGFYF